MIDIQEEIRREKTLFDHKTGADDVANEEDEDDGGEREWWVGVVWGERGTLPHTVCTSIVVCAYIE